MTRHILNYLLLINQKISFDFDYDMLCKTVLEHEIYVRPWGYYKTMVLNDTFQSKVIYILPEQRLSLQSHEHREEYWIIISGNGRVQLGESTHPVNPGDMFFIPKGCKHSISNESTEEIMVFSEVQLGDYFGEDDIKRYSDIYGRK
ncbi:phosphomannose isomerase type II C-terminal cupin domain [Methanomethylophilus alvi]|uniref:phosphomannose isomerase type II C-terminal cupin domain n=1 Tax=Methanomethylophilus alvi TaxID=1291540 RepID=UPI0037DCEBE9